MSLLEPCLYLRLIAFFSRRSPLRAVCESDTLIYDRLPRTSFLQQKQGNCFVDPAQCFVSPRFTSLFQY